MSGLRGGLGLLLATLVAVLLLLAGWAASRYWSEGWFALRRSPDSSITYKHVHGQALRLQVFTPRRTPCAGLRPALLLFHGGGWQTGSAAQFYPQCRFFRGLGMTCISVEYRTASRHGSTPLDALQDARDAMRFVRRHAAGWCVAPDQVAAGGGSAGGHLAAALGTAVSAPDAGRDPNVRARPDALVLFSPMLDLAPGMPDHDRVAGYWHSVSPLQSVDGGLPATLVLSGTRDAEASPATVRAFCARALQHGRSCDALLYDGAGHGFFNPEVAQGRWFDETNSAVARFLKSLGWL